jgi:DNA-binding MarR family transcriptional regulator
MGGGPVDAGREACNCAALRRAARRVSLMYDRHLAASGLTTGQYSILTQISRRGQNVPSLSVLASVLVMDRTALTHTLKPLERDGLVKLEVDPADRRARLVHLTQQGRRKLAAARDAWSAAQDRFNQSFGQEQAAALRALLQKVESAELGEDR